MSFFNSYTTSCQQYISYYHLLHPIHNTCSLLHKKKRNCANSLSSTSRIFSGLFWLKNGIYLLYDDFCKVFIFFMWMFNLFLFFKFSLFFMWSFQMNFAKNTHDHLIELFRWELKICLFRFAKCHYWTWFLISCLPAMTQSKILFFSLKTHN